MNYPMIQSKQQIKQYLDQEYKRLSSIVGIYDLVRGKKLHEAILRYNKRNEHLYNDDKIEGYDYVICPVLNIRFSMIKSSYIENVLGWSVEQYKDKYPNQQMVCNSRIENIKKGLSETIDGKSKHQISVEKSKIIKNIVGNDGLTINQRKGKKTRETHMNNVDENGLNGYQRIAQVDRPKQIETMAKEGKCASNSEKFEWECYKNFITWLTHPQKEQILEGRKTGRAGTIGAFHVDHIYSVINGFHNKISPFAICNISNLRAITWEENVKKNHNSDISNDKLFNITAYNTIKNDEEFNKFMNCIKIMDERKLEYSSITLWEIYNESNI